MNPWSNTAEGSCSLQLLTFQTRTDSSPSTFCQCFSALDPSMSRLRELAECYSQQFFYWMHFPLTYFSELTHPGTREASLAYERNGKHLNHNQLKTSQKWSAIRQVITLLVLAAPSPLPLTHSHNSTAKVSDQATDPPSECHPKSPTGHTIARAHPKKGEELCLCSTMAWDQLKLNHKNHILQSQQFKCSQSMLWCPPSLATAHPPSWVIFS